jgi:uncharacterized protein (DUF1330 family)
MKKRIAWNKGLKMSKEYCEGRMAKLNPNWRGGKYSREGYKLIYSPNHPNKNNRGYVAEHRLIVEKHIGRYLTKDELIHHINEIKDDNRIENLIVVEKRKHQVLHTVLRFVEKYGTIENFYNQFKLV